MAHWLAVAEVVELLVGDHGVGVTGKGDLGQGLAVV